MGKQRHKTAECAYCGAFGPVTRDHVVPQGLWQDGLPSHPSPAKVPACPTCNNEIKSVQDEFIQHLLAVDYQVWESGHANQLFETARKPISAGSSPLSQAIREAEFQWVNHNGVLTPAYVAKVSLDVVERAIADIVRGLSQYYRRHRLPLTTEYVIRRWYDLKGLDETLTLFNQFQAPIHRIGDGSVFDCRFLAPSNQPDTSIWILRFFESAFFTITTHPEGDTPQGIRAYRLPSASSAAQALPTE